MAAGGSRVRLDLNSPEFQDVFLGLPRDDLKQVAASLRRWRDLEWNVLYRHTGFRSESLEHLKAPNGAKVYSLHLSQRIRAVAFRDGEFLRLISLHPDHDGLLRGVAPREGGLVTRRGRGPRVARSGDDA